MTLNNVILEITGGKTCFFRMTLKIGPLYKGVRMTLKIGPYTMVLE